MAEKINAFAHERHLHREEAVAAYLDQAMKEGGPRMLRIALGAVAKARGMSVLADEVGVTREGLYKAFSPAGNPSFDLVDKVTKALGITVHFTPMPRSAPARVTGKKAAQSGAPRAAGKPLARTARTRAAR